MATPYKPRMVAQLRDVRAEGQNLHDGTGVGYDDAKPAAVGPS